MEILFCSGATALQFLPAAPLDYPQKPAKIAVIRRIYGGPSIKNGDIHKPA